MKLSLDKASFDDGVYHTLPSLAVIYNHKQKHITVDVAFLKWNVTSTLFFASKKNAVKKRKVK